MLNLHQAMKTRASNNRDAAMTLVEILVMIATLVFFALVITPSWPLSHPPRANRINCVSNLKQIGIAYRLWEQDHDDKYPMAVSITNGGAMELMERGNVVAGFLVMSNELSTPKILWCPADTCRSWTANFSTLNNSNISYFVGLNVTNDINPHLLLSGDDNFAIDGVPVKPGLLELSTNTLVAWASGRHIAYNAHFWTPTRERFAGNIGMADGSAQQVTTDGLDKALQQTGVATNRLALP